MKKHIFLFLFIITNFSLHAYEERNLLEKKAEQISLKDVLVLNQGWVKYPSYLDREGWNNLLDKDKSFFIKEGEKYLDYQWQAVKATDYLEFERSGNRTSMEAPLNANIKAISNLFLAELAEGKGRFMDQLINGTYFSCEMTSWAASAHLITQSSKRALPNDKEQIIDLISGDAGSMFSWVYYFFNKEFDKEDPSISEKLKQNIYKRMLDPYMDGNRFWWMALASNWNGFVNNWNPWCNSNILQSFLLIENDPEKLQQGVYKTMTSVDKFINYTKEDGACEEGPAYWPHAAGKMYDYLQLLSDATNGQMSIFDKPIIKNMGEYISRSYVGDLWVVNFADAVAKQNLDYDLIYRFGKAVNSIEMMEFSAYLKKAEPVGISTSRDIYRALGDLSSEKEIDSQKPLHINPPYTWYPQTEFCYMIVEDAFFASKGGYNDESHNHNDIGTFSLYISKLPVFIDAGVGTYNRKTFSSDRYSIWSMQSDYHSVPKINGFSQEYGKMFESSDVKFNDKQRTFSLDISKAYSDKASIAKWIRTYKLTGDALIIEDNFSLKEAKSPNQINFMTWVEPNISKKGVVKLIQNDKQVELHYDSNKFTPSVEKIALDDKRMTDIWGDKIYRLSLNANKALLKDTYKFTIKY